MRAVIFLTALVSMSAELRADCVGADGPQAEKVRVLETWKARHVSQGLLDGCLLKFERPDRSSGFAYTHYGFICDLKREEPLEVSSITACCDAGDQGDFSCGVKPVNPVTRVPQVSVTLVPAKPDRRAIPDLIAALKSAGTGASNVSARLLQYWKDPALKPELKKYLKDLRDLFANASSPDVKAAVGELLKEMDPQSVDEVAAGLAIVESRYPLSREKRFNAVVELSAHPEAGEKIVPALIEFLRRSYELDERRLAVSALMRFPAQVKPRLSEIRTILREGLEKSDPVVSALWQELVCAALPLAPGATASRVLWGKYDNASPVDCPFAGASERVPLEKREDPVVEDGSGVRAWSYDLAQDKWTRIDSKDAPPFYQFGGQPSWWDVVAVKSKLFVWGARGQRKDHSSSKDAGDAGKDDHDRKSGATVRARVRAAPLTLHASGGILDVESGRWQSVPAKDSPEGRSAFELLAWEDGAVVWGGELGEINGGPTQATTGGARFDLKTRAWASIPEIQPRLELNWPSALIVNHELWGLGFAIPTGIPAQQWVERGGVYDLKKRAWTDIAPALGDQVPNRHPHLAWTGNELLAWGPRDLAGKCQTAGSRYPPKLRKWQSLPPLSLECEGAGAAWTGQELLVWDGKRHFAVFDPKANQWRRVRESGLAPRENEMVLWSAPKLILWPTGVYDLKKDRWEPLELPSAVKALIKPRLLPLGEKLFVFGGRTEAGSRQNLNSGGLFDLKTLSWKPLSQKNAPSLREYVGVPRAFAVGGRVVLIDAGSMEW